MPIWTNFTFRIIITWVNLIAALCILVFHCYRLCYLQRNLTGSSIKIFKIISFQHLSFVVIIAGILPLLFQAIMYSPQQTVPDSTCRFSAQFGIVCLAILKLALHLFVAVRSQVARGTTNIWYTIGLLLISSDVLYIAYVVSGIPTIQSIQHGALCKPVSISLPVYVWFGMNDFVIGAYCLLAFILPLRKYVWLEAGEDPMTIHSANGNNAAPSKPTATGNAKLHDITKRVMIYSTIALLSTMMFTVIASVVSESGGVLFPVDGTLNALCVVLQFKNRSNKKCACFSSGVAVQSMTSLSRTSNLGIKTDITPNHKLQVSGNVSMVIHPKYTKNEPTPNKPDLKHNVSLSTSLVKEEAAPVSDL